MRLFFNLRPIYLFAMLAMAISSCKDDAEPAAETGTLLAYTNIAAADFDRIDVFVDGKVGGTLTAPFVVKPTCGAAASPSVVSINLPAGNHKVYAIQYKGGKNVGEWEEENETITQGKCTPINWTE